MAVKIRLSRGGRKKAPFYHIIIADARAPRDGKFIDRIGTYNPMTKPATIDLDRDKAFEWLMKGAQPTETVRAMLRFKGVLYRKHLARGVAKGALDQDAADNLYQEWIAAKEARIAERRAVTEQEKEAERLKVFGSPKKRKVVEAAPATEALEEFKATEAEAPAEDAAPAAETPAAEAPAVEAPAAEEPAKEEAPVAEEPAKEETKVEEAVAPVVAAAAATATTESDDLTKIEGIGPAIAKVLNGASINTFAALAASDANKIKGILENAEGNFKMHDPGTWPKQAEMANAGDWDGLKKWQDELDGGKVAATSSEEE